MGVAWSGRGRFAAAVLAVLGLWMAAGASGLRAQAGGLTAFDELLPVVLQHQKAAHVITTGAVPAIIALVREADLLLVEARRQGDLLALKRADALFIKSIMLARTEFLLRRELRTTLRRLETVRRDVRSAGSASGARVRALREAERHLEAVRGSHAFEQLRHPFIRGELRLANQALARASAATTADPTLSRDLVAFGRALRTARRGAGSGDARSAALLKRADEAYRQAQAALDGSRTDEARRALTEAQGQLAAAAPGVPSSSAAEVSSEASLGDACRQALEACDRLRPTAALAAEADAVARGVVDRADGYVTEARRLLDAGEERQALEQARLAERLYQRALRLAPGANP